MHSSVLSLFHASDLINYNLLRFATFDSTLGLTALTLWIEQASLTQRLNTDNQVKCVPSSLEITLNECIVPRSSLFLQWPLLSEFDISGLHFIFHDSVTSLSWFFAHFAINIRVTQEATHYLVWFHILHIMHTLYFLVFHISILYIWIFWKYYWNEKASMTVFPIRDILHLQ